MWRRSPSPAQSCSHASRPATGNLITPLRSPLFLAHRYAPDSPRARENPCPPPSALDPDRDAPTVPASTCCPSVRGLPARPHPSSGPGLFAPSCDTAPGQAEKRVGLLAKPNPEVARGEEAYHSVSQKNFQLSVVNLKLQAAIGNRKSAISYIPLRFPAPGCNRPTMPPG